MKYRILFPAVLLFIGFVLPAGAQTYDEWVNRSFGFMETKELHKAEECLVSALRLEPANPQNGLLLSNLGTIQRRQAKFSEALISYNSGLMVMPRSVTLLLNRASLFCEMDSLRDALADYTTVVSYEPENEEALYLRGLLKLQLADTTGARRDFDRIIEFSGNSAKARIGLAALGKYLGRYSESELLYTMVIANNPRNADLYLNRAEVFLLQNKLAKAKEDIDKSIDLRGDNPLAYLLRGRIYLRLYEKQSAANDFNRARQLGVDPNLIPK